MDETLIARAIRKAIEGGAVLAPPMPALGDDTSAVRTQTDIGIEPAVFETFVSELRADRDMEKFNRLFANVPHGGGVSVNLPNIARVLLARAIATDDVEGTVARFSSYVERNATSSLAVMGISGVTLDREIRLGPHISLMPMSSVPPSMQRGWALGNSRPGFAGFETPVSSALITQFEYTPVFYLPKNPQPPEEMAAHIPTHAAQHLLHEARNVLGVLGIHPVYRTFWVQPVDWLMSSGITSGSQFAPGGFYERETAVPVEQAEAIAAAYFELPARRRNDWLRIPLDRLGRAAREGDFADRAIDLGIALESLLLRDTDDRGELGFRLSLRGAWLLGENETQRLEILASLKALYKLRSKAAHSGHVERSAKTSDTIARATEICRALIAKMIELQCKVDWEQIVLGGAPSNSFGSDDENGDVFLKA